MVKKPAGKVTKGKAKAKAKHAMKRPAAVVPTPKKKPKAETAENHADEGQESKPSPEAAQPTEEAAEKKDGKKAKGAKTDKPKEAKKDKNKDDKKGKNKDDKTDKSKDEKKDKNKDSAKVSKGKEKLLERAEKIKVSQDTSEEGKEQSDDEKRPESSTALAEKRDPKKAYFFRKQMEKLPEPVRDLFNSNKVSREDKTKLVNGVVQEGEDGKMVIQDDAPVLKMLQKFYTDVKGKEKAKGYPRALMLAKLGSEAMLQKALQDGDVRIVQEKGKEYYVFNTIEISKTTGAVSGTEGQVLKETTDSSQLASFSAFVDSFKPTFSHLANTYANSFSCIFDFFRQISHAEGWRGCTPLDR